LATPRIDSHHHLWQLGQFDYSWLDAPALSPIRRDFLPADLKPCLDEVHIDRTIVVQTQHDERENLWACELAERHAWIAGVVGWVDLASTDCRRQVEQCRTLGKFVGVRHVTQDEPDDNFIVRDDVVRGLRVLEQQRLPFDLLFYARHLRHAVTLARALPNLPLVIDHLAKPSIRSAQWDDWAEAFRAASRFPQVHCKLSGMITEADWNHWTVDNLRPYVDLALECFGPRRCMFGSDWPVCLLAGSYRQVYDALAACISELSADEQSQIWGQTAARFYRIAPT
jgi:L-fuconolactonase